MPIFKSRSLNKKKCVNIREISKTTLQKMKKEILKKFWSVVFLNKVKPHKKKVNVCEESPTVFSSNISEYEKIKNKNPFNKYFTRNLYFCWFCIYS